METQSIAAIKKELTHISEPELLAICLRLIKFKKANKELAHYLLFEAQDENAYVAKINALIKERFNETPTHSAYFAMKHIRKTLKLVNQYSAYSDLVQTEIDLLLFFLEELKPFKKYYPHQLVLSNLWDRQLVKLHKLVAKLHEDLQYDYERRMNYEL
ncbi:MAG: hypothetical protein Q8R57_06955 [Bacteroidota bacterium]|nr:hypothetical protein [Bacteroidota bacterium]